MNLHHFGGLLTAALLLVGCNSNGNNVLSAFAPVDAGAGAESTLARNAELCVSSSCGEAVPLVDIPDAENLQFSSDGRLFVSGGSDIYEITKAADGSFQATPLANAGCGFNGIAIKGDMIYTVGCNNTAWAAKLTAHPIFTKIFDFTNTCIANGAAIGADGNLYVVDEPLLPNCLPPDPKIMRLTIDPTDPFRILAQETWVQGSPAGGLFLNLDSTLRFPNGLVAEGRHFYSTDGGSVFSVELLPDGSAGPVTPLFFEPTAHDDLGLTADGLLVSDFAGGRVVLLDRNGQLLQETDRLTVTEASSVRLGQPPMFESTDVLITDKGIIGEQSLPIDRLVLFRRKR